MPVYPGELRFAHDLGFIMLPSLRKSASRSLIGVADEHHVGFAVAADDGELFAIEGEVEVADEFGFEIGELLAGRAVERLQPEIVGIPITDGIDNALSVVYFISS